MHYVSMNQECCGILIFLANQIFRFLLVRVDYWYLWKTHFLNFRDFQESPNPLKIPITTPDECLHLTEKTTYQPKMILWHKMAKNRHDHYDHFEGVRGFLEIPKVQKMGFP